MSFLKSKWFWLDLIALIVAAVQYLGQWPGNTAVWLFWEGLVLVILNMIAGMIQSAQVATLRAKQQRR